MAIEMWALLRHKREPGRLSSLPPVPLALGTRPKTLLIAALDHARGAPECRRPTRFRTTLQSPGSFSRSFRTPDRVAELEGLTFRTSTN